MPKTQVLADMVKVYYIVDRNNLRYPLTEKEYAKVCDIMDSSDDNKVVIITPNNGTVLRMRSWNIAVAGESLVAKEKAPEDELLTPLE